jgi:hypothetical protein
VHAVLSLLAEQLARSMALMGAASIDAISASHLAQPSAGTRSGKPLQEPAVPDSESVRPAQP